MKWWHIVLIVAILFGGIWIFRSVTTPAPGTKVDDQGREHVSYQEVEKTTYNSNPPTSGRHVPTWTKPGVYDKPQHDGDLIHSLEHGYIVISYNCGVHLQNQKSKIKYQKYISKIKNNKSLIDQVMAHEEGEEGTESSNLVSPEAVGSAVNESDGCKAFIKSLTDLANKKRLWKLVVVPRPTLDTTIALTAWGYIDKFDPPAGGFDAKRIEGFIDYHRDQGPEKTME